MTEINIPINTCDECNSLYYAGASIMAGLCPECTHHVYGYNNCSHQFINGRCKKCHWDGSTSVFVQSLKNKV